MSELLQNEIPDLLIASGLSKAESIEPIESGVVNPCYKIGNDWVIRFNQRDKNIPKFSREFIAYSRAASMGIPVPNEVKLTQSSQGLEVLIASYVEGTQIQKLWNNWDDEVKDIVCQNVAIVLRKIHTIKFKKFGGLAESEPKFTSWKEYLVYRAKYHFNECYSDKLLKPESLNQIVATIEKYNEIFTKVTSPCLIHGDFHFGNILVDKNYAVAAVLDWEWSLAGDPLFEFLNKSNLNGECPDSFHKLIQNYELKWPFSDEIEIKYKIYQLVTAVEMMWVSHRHFSPKYSWGKEYLEKNIATVTRILNELE